MERTFFGIDKNGNEIFCYTLKSGDSSVSILNYGATIQSLKIKNKAGELVDIALGFDNLGQYEKEENRTYFGAVCGRVANRIEKGRFFVEAKEYQIPQNDKGNCLHGGTDGFDKKFFDLTDIGENYLTFSAFSENGEQGFPGGLSVSVKYSFNNGLLLIEYRGKTTADCPVALTNHCYFNLDGDKDIRDHRLKLNSKFYLEIDDNGLANGLVTTTEGTDFDFTKGERLGDKIARIKAARPTIKGIDHYFFCDSGITDYRLFGTLSNKTETLKMDIFTNQTGAQVYTGNFIPELVGKGVTICENSGICIETHTPPNSMKFSHLPTMILKKGESYYHKTGYKFYY